MNHKDIKVGNFYHVLVKVLGINPKNGEFSTETVNEFGTSLNMEPTYFARGEAEAFFPITPENGSKNSEPAPKYDPCRKFRDGDKVRMKNVNGRDFNGLAEEMKGKLLTVIRDEEKHCNIYVSDLIGDIFTVDPAYLELVTPAEEREPYKVKEIAPFDGNETRTQFDVVGDFDYVVASFYLDTHPHAKEAAEAECARLNAEHRKEQK